MPNSEITRSAVLYNLDAHMSPSGIHFIHVVYLHSLSKDKSHLQYHDATHALTFSGDQIHKVDSDIGQLVSVTLRTTVDSGFTSFTMLVPRVELGATNVISVHTLGIITRHVRSDIPELTHGQTEIYTIHPLRGTAHSVGV
jgi:hypothetical protein